MFAIDNHRLLIIGGRDVAAINYYNTSVIYNFDYNIWLTNDTQLLPKKMAGFAAAIYKPNPETACRWAVIQDYNLCPVDEENRPVIYIHGGAGFKFMYNNLTMYRLGKFESPVIGYGITCKP